MKKIIFCTLYFFSLNLFLHGASFSNKNSAAAKVIFDHTKFFLSGAFSCKGTFFQEKDIFSAPEVNFDFKNFYLDFHLAEKKKTFVFDAGRFSFGKTFSRMKNPQPAVSDALRSGSLYSCGLSVNLPAVTSAAQNYSFFFSYSDKIKSTVAATSKDFSSGNFFISLEKKLSLKKLSLQTTGIFALYHADENTDTSWFTKSAYYPGGYFFSSALEVLLKAKYSSLFTSFLLSENPFGNLLPSFRLDYSFKSKNSFFKTYASLFYCHEDFFSVKGEKVSERFFASVNPQIYTVLSKNKNFKMKIGFTGSISLKENIFYDTEKFGLEISKSLFSVLVKSSMKNIFTEEKAFITSSVKYTKKSGWNDAHSYLMYLKAEYSVNPQKQNDVPLFLTTFSTEWFPEKKGLSTKVKCEAVFKQVFYSLELGAALSFKALHGKCSLEGNLLFPGNKSINKNPAKVSLNLGYEVLFEKKH